MSLHCMNISPVLHAIMAGVASQVGDAYSFRVRPTFQVCQGALSVRPSSIRKLSYFQLLLQHRLMDLVETW